MKDGLLVATAPKRGTMAYLEAFPNQVLTMTLEEYWESEPQNAYKSQFFQNKVTSIMPYTSEKHNDIVLNIATAVRPILRQKQWKVHTENRPVWIESAELNTYPDVFIVEKSTLVTIKGTMTAETTPSVIIEVLSPSNQSDDRGKKLRAYKQLPTIEQIILVSQTEPLVEIYERGRGERWEVLEVYGLHKTVEIAGLEVSLATIYAEIDFNQLEETVD